MEKIVLGVKIDDITMDEAVGMVLGWLKGKGKSFGKVQDRHYIVTPNPEFLVAAQNDSHFKNILNEADLAIPDGAGLKLSGKVKNTVYGTDLMEKLVALAAEKGFTIGLLGGKEGIAEKCAECLLQKYPRLNIVFTESGGEVDADGNVIARNNMTKQSSSEINKIATGRSFDPRNDRGVDLLFVAFGQIKQEKWIAKNLDKLDVKVAMGVGGAFDYLSGEVPRAPGWIRKLGFEWLFRLSVQPWRVKRQLALIKYLLMLS